MRLASTLSSANLPTPALGIRFAGVLLVLAALLALPVPTKAQTEDTVRPTLVSARTDGSNIILTFSEEVFLSPLVRYVQELYNVPFNYFVRPVFDVTINGHQAFLNDGYSLSGTELTLFSAYTIYSDDEVRIAYNNIFAQNAGGVFVDAAGNTVPYFSSTTVQNNAESGTSSVTAGLVLNTGETDPSEITIEEGSSGTFTIALASQPSEDVTVKVSAFIGVRISTDELTFTPEDWDTPQTVTIFTTSDGDSIDAWAIVWSFIDGDSHSFRFVKILVDDQDTPLVVSGGASTDYAENDTSAVATYSVADGGTETVFWRLLGHDKSAFSLSQAGELTFKTPPDYESPADSSGDNLYQVTIHASKGSSTGALLDVAVNVTDVEPPSAPDAPTVSLIPGVPDSLDVSWDAPDNTDSYDLQYREAAGGSWNDGTQNQTGTSATITGLDGDTSYQVQVRASNDEGDSPWSDAGTGQTYAPPTVSSLAISSDPGTDRTYALGDEIQVTVTFSETVEVTGTPQLRLELGGGRRTAAYEGGSGSVDLVFAYEVADGDSDMADGVGVEADSLSLNGGTIRDTSDNPAGLDHDGLTANASHKVDGVRPELASAGGAVATGTTLRLTYDELLDGSSTPESGDFTMSGGDHARMVTGVGLSGSTVVLTLDVGAEHGEAGIRVSYTPGTNPLRDVAGNEAAALSLKSVTNETPDPTAPLTLETMTMEEAPVSGPFAVRFSFSEEVTVFSGSEIETGQDPMCRDELNNTVFCDPGIGGLQTGDNRVFTTTVTPSIDRVDHSYTLTLTVPGDAVRSSVGNKPNEKGMLEVRVSPPGAPEPISTLSLAANGSNESVRMSWNRPSDNGGSPIIRYEYRYAAIGEAWSEWENVGAGSSGVTVGGLINGREYVIEARAVNALGKGGVETVMATPVAGGGNGSGGGGGGGGGGGLLFAPEAPAVLTATPGDGAVRLGWSPPASDGGAEILRYEYRLKEGLGEVGEWTPIPDSAPGEVNASGYTLMGLLNGTVYALELRAVNQIGNGRETEAVEAVMALDPAYRSNFRAEDLEGGEAGLEWTPFGGSRRSLKVRFGGGLRFVESELDTAGEVTATRMGSYRYRYTSQRTGELSLDYDGGETCELRMSFSGVGAGSYSYRCGGALQGQGSFRLSELNRRPEITSPGQFEVVENQAKVVRLEAVDSDEGDEVAGYGIAGGADAALFRVVEETGELSFTEAPDYERPADAVSAEPESPAGDNEYVVVVEARSGEGERVRRRSRTIRVRVSDEEEPPGAVPAPEVTAEGTDSLTVSWSEPENRGPEITGYEVRYREEGEEGYRDGGHEGTGLRLTLTGLEEERLYRVEVRAMNEEGRGEWSQPGEGRTGMDEPDAEDPADFSEEDLEGRRATLRITGEEGTARRIELRFAEGNRFEQIERVEAQAAIRSESADSRSESTTSRTGAYTYERTGPRKGRLGLDYDDGSSCEVSLTFTELGEGRFVYDCGEGEVAAGSFRLTTGSPFVPVILSSAGRNNSFFTSELTLTNRGMEEATLHYIYTADAGGGSGTATDRIDAGRQKIETDALDYLRGLGVPIPATGNRIGTLRVEVKLGSEVEAVVRTTTLVPEGRAGLAYLGVAEEEGFSEPVYLCGLRQNSQDRSNVAFQNMGTSEEGAITLRTTVYSGEAADAMARMLDDVTLEPGGFHQYSGLLGSVENGYVKVERVEGEAPFYAYGVINDQANSDGSFVFPVTASSLTGTTRQTLPVIVETGEFRSELTVTNFSEEPRRLEFEFVGEQVKTDDKTVAFSMELEAGEQAIVPEVVEELRRQGVAGLGTSRGFYLGPLFVVAEEGDLSGIVIGARTGSKGGGGQYSVFYNAVPEGEAFEKEAWVDGLQQNEENRSNLALVNTGEIDDSASIFHLEIYNGETGMLEETVVTKPIPARGWHQIDGILLRANPETRQGYIRIEKVSGENPFLAYGVVNDGGAPGERSGDGAYLPARE